MSIQAYLPSKSFGLKILILLVVVLVAGSLYIFKPFSKENAPSKLAIKINANPEMTLGDLITTDSNKNSIPDWEETLWGLDPEGDGVSNKAIIDSKKALSAPVDEEITDGTDPSDNLAKKLFGTIVSLNQVGELDSQTMALISADASAEVINTDLEDTYKAGNLKTIISNKTNLRNYQTAVGKIVDKYENSSIGEELAIAGEGVENEDTETLNKLETISLDYKNLALDLSHVTVPRGIAGYHLDLINSYDKIGTALEHIIESVENPLVGLSGTGMYNRYVLESEEAINMIEENLIANGIIQQE